MKHCKKCNGAEISVKYSPEGENVKFNRPIEDILKYIRNDTYYNIDEVKIEHLVFTCKNCGYMKAEDCKDNI